MSQASCLVCLACPLPRWLCDVSRHHRTLASLVGGPCGPDLNLPDSLRLPGCVHRLPRLGLDYISGLLASHLLALSPEPLGLCPLCLACPSPRLRPGTAGLLCAPASALPRALAELPSPSHFCPGPCLRPPGFCAWPVPCLAGCFDRSMLRRTLAVLVGGSCGPDLALRVALRAPSPAQLRPGLVLAFWLPLPTLCLMHSLSSVRLPSYALDLVSGRLASVPGLSLAFGHVHAAQNPCCAGRWILWSRPCLA